MTDEELRLRNEIIELLEFGKPRLRYRIWHKVSKALWKVSKRYRGHCLIYHSTCSNPDQNPS